MTPGLGGILAFKVQVYSQMLQTQTPSNYNPESLRCIGLTSEEQVERGLVAHAADGVGEAPTTRDHTAQKLPGLDVGSL